MLLMSMSLMVPMLVTKTSESGTKETDDNDDDETLHVHVRSSLSTKAGWSATQGKLLPLSKTWTCVVRVAAWPNSARKKKRLR